MTKGYDFFIKYYDSIIKIIKVHEVQQIYVNFIDNNDCQLFVEFKGASDSNKIRKLRKRLEEYSRNVGSMLNISVYDINSINTIDKPSFEDIYPKSLISAINNNDFTKVNQILGNFSKKVLFEDGIFDFKPKFQHFILTSTALEWSLKHFAENLMKNEVSTTLSTKILAKLYQYFDNLKSKLQLNVLLEPLANFNNDSAKEDKLIEIIQLLQIKGLSLNDQDFEMLRGKGYERSEHILKLTNNIHDEVKRFNLVFDYALAGCKLAIEKEVKEGFNLSMSGPEIDEFGRPSFRENSTILHAASSGGNFTITEYIIGQYKEKFDNKKIYDLINRQDKTWDSTPLHLGMMQLSRLQANFNDRKPSKDPLKAVDSCYQNIKILLENGANPKIINNTNQTPLQACLEFLPDYSTSQKTDDGYKAEKILAATIKLFIDYGVEITEEDCRKLQSSGYPHTAEILQVFVKLPGSEVESLAVLISPYSQR